MTDFRQWMSLKSRMPSVAKARRDICDTCGAAEATPFQNRFKLNHQRTSSRGCVQMSGRMRRIRVGALSVLVAAGCMAFSPICAVAQAPDANAKPLAFEVVSIRRDQSPAHGDDIKVTADGWHAAH